MNDDSYVFLKGPSTNIVIMKKLDDTITNIVDKDKGLFKGNKFYVEKIIDIDGKYVTELPQVNFYYSWDQLQPYLVAGTIIDINMITDHDYYINRGIEYYLTIDQKYKDMCRGNRTNIVNDDEIKVQNVVTLEEVKKTYKKYTDDTSYVYKKDEYDYRKIIILKKLPDTITNESRTNIHDKLHAWYCGNKFYVEKIFNMQTLVEYDSISGYYDYDWQERLPKINYVVGTIVTTKKSADEYIVNESKWIQSFKYTLTLEQAYYHCCEVDVDIQLSSSIPIIQSGKFNTYHMDGSPDVEIEVITEIMDKTLNRWVRVTCREKLIKDDYDYDDNEEHCEQKKIPDDPTIIYQEEYINNKRKN
uniref:Uncharacterized protein n=1 Tax=viral metagenome TaxID=1070528 RepID=A0A6C0EC75_9ZZZZ